MNHKLIISSLERNLSSFSSLLQKQSKMEYLYKKESTDWCILEILCHLIDEEREDFRMRVQTVLSSPFKHPPVIDPEDWVIKRKYIQQDFDQKLEEFKTERSASIAYLNTLKNPHWENYYEHPILGKLDANHFLRNWLAHDYLHIRQITKRKYQYLQMICNDDCSYAGNW